MISRPYTDMSTQLDFLEPKKPAPRLDAGQKLLADKAAYMRTAKWKKIRKAKLDQTRGQCEKCGSWTGRKDVHHKTYDRVGNERLEDLIVLCTPCHEIEDERRVAEAMRRAEQALDDTIFYNGLDTYMTKKYGEDWRETGLHDHAREEFSEWLEEVSMRGD
jgi:5-methylcytosine-specific restriction endonuclease McrA